MPHFTIESTFDLPVYRHRTYEADTLEAAIALASDDDDWHGAKEDYDTSGPTRITGVWEGADAAYMGKAVEFPDEPSTLLREAAPEMLAALIDLLSPGKVSASVIESGRDLLARLGHDVRASTTQSPAP